MFLNNALDAAKKCATEKRPVFAIGDKVVVHCRDYGFAKGEVIGYETNMLGLPLIEIRTESGSTPVFYPHELAKDKNA